MPRLIAEMHKDIRQGNAVRNGLQSQLHKVPAERILCLRVGLRKERSGGHMTAAEA